jgi:transketolase
VETEKATLHCLLEIDGPCYVRFAREATPVVSKPATPYVFGLANVIRYRGPQPTFADAFETILGPRYQNENENAAIIACGPMVPEAMRAACLLKQEYGIETRIVNVHTVKPLDVRTLVQAAEHTQLVVTAEEHQVGGFGNIIAGAILQHRAAFQRPLQLAMVGVADRFGVSGKPWELVQHFGLTAEHLAKKVMELMDKRMEFSRSASTQVREIQCMRCGANVSLSEIAQELPPPSDELCADCDHRAPEICALCRLEWARLSHDAVFVCRDCRATPVLC